MSTSCTSTACIYGRTCVPSSGPQPAPIAVVAEAPGWKEVQELRPLVGPAGQLFDKMLAAAGLDRSLLRLINTTSCVDLQREDKRPLPAEIDACRPRLLDDIAATNPAVILSMGNTSINLFFPGMTIGKVHGHLRNWQGHVVLATYHPAAALPFRSPHLQPLIERDMKLAKELAGI